ncbi:MAG: GTP-binding protein [Deltaproteobacteria bacterium]|nr:MAG: GTP-binding protein [Deltaproteobacteria bacterium]
MSGRVVDAATQRPIAGALVTIDDQVTVSDEHGLFMWPGDGEKIAARAAGYLRTGQTLLVPFAADHLRLELTPFTPKALYLSGHGVANRTLREAALRLLADTELNALVIDVKGDWGQLSHRSDIPMAAAIGAQRNVPVKDLAALVDEFKGRGIYLIARIVVFKDDPLARARPELAVRTTEGTLFRDREGLGWGDPFAAEVREYNIAVAVEAARLGFDEIQFDYVRFPDRGGLRFSRPNTEANRVAAIGEFLEAARQRLVPYNVFLSADIFGYVCWNLDDTDIGQRLPDIAAAVDYLAPMLYPSGFQFGIPGYRNPVANPYQIVNLSLERAKKRTGLPGVRFRPWLQAFRDYAFDRRSMAGQPLRDQIDAAEDAGTHGWMLWNPANVYPGDGLR